MFRRAVKKSIAYRPGKIYSGKQNLRLESAFFCLAAGLERNGGAGVFLERTVFKNPSSFVYNLFISIH